MCSITTEESTISTVSSKRVRAKRKFARSSCMLAILFARVCLRLRCYEFIHLRSNSYALPKLRMNIAACMNIAAL